MLWIVTDLADGDTMSDSAKDWQEAPVPITRFIANPISATSRPKTP